MDDETNTPIRLYIGICETKWNHHPVAPGEYACVSPVYGRTEKAKVKNPVFIPDGCSVLSDSGAFSDGPSSRLLLGDAMARQLSHAEQYKYMDKIVGFASYDLLIDEKWIDGRRHKRRWGESDAWEAVDKTVDAARFVHEHRPRIPSSLVLSAQGVTASQYTECVKRIAPLFQPGDTLGLGGWCILGQRRSLMPIFRETILSVIPLASVVTSRIHIWGVLYAPAIGELLWMCDQYNLALSTDSTGPSVRPTRGRWGYMGWADKNYKRPPVETRGLERARHVKATRKWLRGFRELEYYKEPIPKGVDK